MTRLEGFKLIWAETTKDQFDFDNAVNMIVRMERQGLLDACHTADEFNTAFWIAEEREQDSPPDSDVNDQRTDLLQELKAAGIHRPKE